ncbi:MAG: retropepsin-like aspartic protease [bacterium]
MGLIYKEVELIGIKGQRSIRALFDTGASESFVRRDIAEEITSLIKLSEPKTFEAPVGKIQTQLAIIPDIALNGHRLFWTLIVVDGLTEEAILGADFFQRWKIRLEPETENIMWDVQALKLKLI